MTSNPDMLMMLIHQQIFVLSNRVSSSRVGGDYCHTMKGTKVAGLLIAGNKNTNASGDKDCDGAAMPSVLQHP